MTGYKFFPQSVVWEITFACNMRCIHCGTSAGRRRPDELSTEEAISLIDELANLGCQTLTLSGGEPLLRDDWPILARRSKFNGVQTYLITNGFAVKERDVDEMAAVGLDHVGLSFDGTRATHNYIRQRNDSYDRVLLAMDMLRSRRVPFCAVSQISNINLEELGDMHRTLVDHGCKTWRIQMTTSTGRMKHLSNLVLSLDNYPRLIHKILELKRSRDINIDVGENIGYYGCKGSELRDGEPYYGCYAGTRVAGIASNGAVKGCLSLPEEFVEGNIRDSSFTEIWNRSGAFAYNRRFTRDTASGACYDCKYLVLCRGGCTTTSYSQTGRRADNPYCMYQVELKQGIDSQDNDAISSLLSLYNPERMIAGEPNPDFSVS